MNKILIQASLTLLLFFGLYAGLRQIDWMEVLAVEKTSKNTEEKLGELLWESIESTEEVIRAPFAVKCVDSIANALCTANGIDRDKLHIHLIKSVDINAFAMPGGHLIVYSGLIEASDNAEELAGVMAHEIAHIELQHVMKKLVKEVGISVIISMTTGNNSGEFVKQIFGTLSSSAFDRSLEEEADIQAVRYLMNAEINPEPFANFMYKMAQNEPEMMRYFRWVNTHPLSNERAEYIVELIDDKQQDYTAVLHPKSWEKLQKLLQN